MSRRVLVLGNGMVGARFVEEIRRRDPDGRRVRVTVIGAEARPAYNRVLLSSVLAGGLSARSVQLQPAGWAARHRVDLRTGVRAIGIDRCDRHVSCDDGTVEGYHELVLATGSRAWSPPIDGLDDESVTTFRDLDDCTRIIGMAHPGSRFAVLGGGLLGCEAARGLAGRGVRVTLVHLAEVLMERQLDAGAGAVLAATLHRLGTEVRLGEQAIGWEPWTGLRLAGGELVPADALVVAAGVRADTGVARDAGIAVQGDRAGGAVLVDDSLRTSDPRVHAIGDCAAHPGSVPGLVQPGWEQAVVLADLLTGADPAARYTGTRTVTRLKARDVDLATAGDPGTLDGAGAEVLRFSDPEGGRYAALALRDDRVIGGATIGLPDAAASMIQLYDTGAPAPADRLGLLLGRSLPATATPTADPGRLPGAAVVCRCNTVTKAALVTAWRAGATEPAALARSTRAGTGCGSCAETVAGICDWLAESDPQQAPALAAVGEEGAA